MARPKGIPHTEEWKKAMSLRMKESHPFRGRKHTEEAKARISSSKKGTPAWNKGSGKRYLGSQNQKYYRKSVSARLERELKPSEVVHHIDKDRRNNELANLYLFRSHAAHLRWHGFLKRHGLEDPLVSNIA